MEAKCYARLCVRQPKALVTTLSHIPDTSLSSFAASAYETSKERAVVNSRKGLIADARAVQRLIDLVPSFHLTRFLALGCVSLSSLSHCMHWVLNVVMYSMKGPNMQMKHTMYEVPPPAASPCSRRLRPDLFLVCSPLYCSNDFGSSLQI